MRIRTDGKGEKPAMGTLQLDTFLDAMDGSVCLLEVGESIEVIYANSGFWKMLGRQQDTLQLPCPLEEAGIHPDYLAEYGGLIRRVAEDGSEIRHIQKISADGKNWIWRRCKLVSMKGFSDALPVIMEQATDISRLIEMQKQLQESNERLRVAFGQTPHILWEVDIERKTYNIFDVNTQACAVDCPSGRRNVNLTVSPVPLNDKEEVDLVAVLFMESSGEKIDGITEKYDVDTTAARRIADLEQELHESQNDLKSTIGELETVNEELQAANEELLTANEELQSSNEELQSVNEELYTVNTEYQQKLDELTMLTNDLSNFLSSTMIGILFVDSNLNIRKFTEYIGREFQLMEHDVGRSLQIFAHSFPNEDIIKDAREVLKNLVPIDREVTAMSGRFYTLRIAPYRTTENNIRGLVITIIDSLGVK